MRLNSWIMWLAARRMTPCPQIRPCQPEAKFTDTSVVLRIQHKAANHPVIVTKRQRQAAASVSYRLIDMKMFVSREERVGIMQPVRVRHPPEPPRDSPVIQAVHQILPVLRLETAK